MLAIALVGGACSDSDDGVGRAGGTEGDSGDDFCADFQALNDELAASEASDEAIVEGLDDLDPPRQIADDFDTVVAAARQLVALDPSDPDAMPQAQATQQAAAEAQQNVSSYIEEECGLDMSTSGTDDAGPDASDGR